MIHRGALDAQDRAQDRAEQKAFGDKAKNRFYARTVMSDLALRLFTDTRQERDDFTAETNEAILRRLQQAGNVEAEIYTIISKDGSKGPSGDMVLITARDGIATGAKPEEFDAAWEERVVLLSTDDLVRADNQS